MNRLSYRAGTLLLMFLFCSGLAQTAVVAHTVQFAAALNGANQVPPNGSSGTGTALVTIDLDLITMRIQANFANLGGNVTAAHIHGPTTQPGVGTAEHATGDFVNFPTTQSGSYDRTFDLAQASTYDAGFIAANGGSIANSLNSLISALEQQRAYLNIHTTAVPTGEIRGFFAAVPEPNGAGLILVMLSGLVRRRRR